MAGSKSVMLRQGDVLLIRVGVGVPEGTLVARDAGRVVLAYGEATGHAHAITADDARLWSSLEDGDTRLFLDITGAAPVALEHEEHDTILVEPGVYEVRR